MQNNELKQLIESIIFVSSSPVTLKELNHYFKDQEAKDLREVLKELVSDFANSERGFELVEISKGYQFRSKAEFADEIINFNKEIKKFRLSKASLEVLAIVAYKQPLTRVEVEQIRGVDCSGVINLLLDKRLLEIRGRKDVPGKPFLYGSTDEFLETFNLKSLNELPTLKEIEELDSELGL
ncbi:MAG: SMC-Scp complex subunit ScpB [Thermodesulfobacteriota bacterium]